MGLFADKFSSRKPKNVEKISLAMHYLAFSLTMGTNHTISLHHKNKPPTSPILPEPSGSFQNNANTKWLIVVQSLNLEWRITRLYI